MTSRKRSETELPNKVPYVADSAPDSEGKLSEPFHNLHKLGLSSLMVLERLVILNV